MREQQKELFFFDLNLCPEMVLVRLDPTPDAANAGGEDDAAAAAAAALSFFSSSAM